MDLEFNSTYVVRIKATDEFGNEATTSPLTFSTSQDTKPPAITQIRSETAISPAGSKIQAIITWKTDEAATSQVFYQEGLGTLVQLQQTFFDTTYVTTHIVVITTFNPATVYKFYVTSQDTAGNLARSKDFTIFTPQRQQSVVQIILKNFEETFGFFGKLGL